MTALDNPNKERFCQVLAKAAVDPDSERMSRGKAYQIAYSPQNLSTCSNSAAQLWKDESVRERYYELVEKHAPLEKALQKTGSLLQAEKPIFYKGERIDSIQDCQVQLAAAKIIIDAHRPDKASVEIDARQQSVNNTIYAQADQLESISSTLSKMISHTQALDYSDSVPLED